MTTAEIELAINQTNAIVAGGGYLTWQQIDPIWPRQEAFFDALIAGRFSVEATASLRWNGLLPSKELEVYRWEQLMLRAERLVDKIINNANEFVK